MWGSSNNAAGWGQHGRGQHGWHVSPLMAVVGLVVLFGLLKSGILIPLLFAGLLFWGVPRLFRYASCSTGPGMGYEKRKRDFGPRGGYGWNPGPSRPADAEKPKNTDEYV